MSKKKPFHLKNCSAPQEEVSNFLRKPQNSLLVNSAIFLAAPLAMASHKSLEPSENIFDRIKNKVSWWKLSFSNSSFTLRAYRICTRYSTSLYCTVRSHLTDHLLIILHSRHWFMEVFFFIHVYPVGDLPPFIALLEVSIKGLCVPFELDKYAIFNIFLFRNTGYDCTEVYGIPFMESNSGLSSFLTMQPKKL